MPGTPRHRRFVGGARPGAALPPSESVPDLLQRQTRGDDGRGRKRRRGGLGALSRPRGDLRRRGGNVDEEGDGGGIKPPPRPGVSGNIRVTGFRAVVEGDLAVATHVDDEHENYHGHELHCQYRTTDTWRRTGDGWKLVGGQVLALRTDPPSGQIAEALRREYCARLRVDGGHRLRDPPERRSSRGRADGEKPEPLLAEAPDVLFVPGQPRYRRSSSEARTEKITGFVERREAWDIFWKRIP